MPVILAQILRTVIMALVSAAPLTAMQEVVDGTLKKLVEDIRDEEGLTLQEAKDIVFNILSDLALNAAIIGTVIKTKIAVKTAEYFGLTSKGLIKRTLTPKAAAVAENLIKDTAKIKGKDFVTKALKVIAVPGSIIWLSSAIANIIEPGIYKPEQTNAVYKRLGIPFQYPTINDQDLVGPFSGREFKVYADALERGGIAGFNNVFAQRSEPYSRPGLANMINAIYAGEVIKGFNPSTSRLKELLRPYLIQAQPVEGALPTAVIQPVAPVTGTSASRVFTGLISQGVVGAGHQFTPRPDDLIESLDELNAAIANNVSPFLATLLNQVTYEVRIQNDVNINGLKIKGQPQQVQTGFFQSGAPKYKTVVNKFAVANLYLLNDKNGRTKIKTLVLGPTDAIKFQPTTGELIKLATEVTANVITSNPNDITGVVSNTPTADIKPADAPPTQVLRLARDDRFLDDYMHSALSIQDFVGRRAITYQTALDLLNNSATFTTARADAMATLQRLIASGQSASTTSNNTSPNSAEASPPAQTSTGGIQPSASVTPTPALAPAALTAQTLSAFYAALGKSLPSLAERADLYQSLGLGQSAFYTGTAEQNTKLLQTLKQRGV